MASAEKPGVRAFASPGSSVTQSALGIGFGWAIVELAPDGILVSDDDGRILMANRQVEDMFGYHRDALVGAHVESLLPIRLRDAHRAYRAKYVDGPATRAKGVGLNLLGLHSDGSEFQVEIGLSSVSADPGTATVLVIRDVSQQQAHERAEWASSVIDEEERIAAELHDRVIGHLFASGLTLASVLGLHQLDDGIAARLREVIGELDAAAQEVRKIVFARLGHSPGTPRSV